MSKHLYHCEPSDYRAIIARLRSIESGELSPAHVDWRTQSGVLWRMLDYATMPRWKRVLKLMTGA